MLQATNHAGWWFLFKLVSTEIVAAILTIVVGLIATSFWFSDGTPLFEWFPDPRVALSVVALVYLAVTVPIVRVKQKIYRRWKVGERGQLWLTIWGALVIGLGLLPTLISLIISFATGGKP